MGNIIWLVIMIPCSMLFTGIGIYAWKREKPMWFWSGTTVKEEEITDVPAYNRANGIMWIAYSLVYWASTYMGWRNMKGAGVFLFVGCMVGSAALVVVYNMIYKKYRR